MNRTRTEPPGTDPARPAALDGGPMGDVPGLREDRDRSPGGGRAAPAATRRDDVLAQAARALLDARDPAAALDAVLTANADILGFDRSYTYEVWPDGRHLRLIHSLNATVQIREFLQRMPYGAPLCGIVAEERAPLVLAALQVSDEPGYEVAKGIGLDAYAGFPIMSGGALRGVISFASTRTPTFDPEALAAFATIAELMSAVYERLDGGRDSPEGGGAEAR